MNIALALGHDNKATLVYDQELGFTHAWIESAADGRGIRIIGEEGHEFTAGLPDRTIIHNLNHLADIVMVRMEGSILWRRPILINRLGRNRSCRKLKAAEHYSPHHRSIRFCRTISQAMRRNDWIYKMRK